MSISVSTPLSRRRIALLLLLTFLVLHPMVSVYSEKAVDEGDRKKEALQIMKDIEGKYPWFDLKGIKNDWKARAKDWKNRAKSLTSDQELIALVADFLDALRDSAVGFSGLKVKLPQAPPLFYAGLQLGCTKKGDVVVITNSSGIYPEARAGTIVMKIDGNSAKAWLDDRALDMWKKGGRFSSPRQVADLLWRFAFLGANGESHTLSLDTEGNTAEIEVSNTIQYSDISNIVTPFPFMLTTKDKYVFYREMPERICYIYMHHVSEWGESAIGEIIEDKMPQPRGIIIDLSAAAGGNFIAWTCLGRYAGKITLIVSGRTAGNAELFARNIVRSLGGQLIGTQTAGAGSKTTEYDLPRGLGKIILPTSSHDGLGGVLEFNGLSPNIEVREEVVDLRKGERTTVNEAYKYLLTHTQ